MKEELEAIERNKTWELIVLPQNKKSINVRWVFKIKLKSDGSVSKHKARLVATRFLQKSSLDYFEVFTPVARGVKKTVNQTESSNQTEVKLKELNYYVWLLN